MLFNQVVTVFHFGDEDNLEKLVFNKSYAHTKSGVKLSKEPSRSEITNVLILYQDNLERIKTGDLIVLNEVSSLYTLERDLRQNYDTYTIQSIENCNQGNVKHYELICK